MGILICYDGSPDADQAVDRAATLFPGQAATVLTIWEGFIEVLSRTGAGLAAAPLDFEQIDANSADRAQHQAEAGAQRARAAGLEASTRVAESTGAIWETVLEEAQRCEADAIVLGTRGFTGVKSLLLGSVSHAVLQHAERPVVVVPGAEIAAERAERRHRAAPASGV
jgi:nucleotide-binding universal stress UspA family protein